MLANQLQQRGEVRHHAALEALGEAYAWIRETLRTWRQRCRCSLLRPWTERVRCCSAKSLRAASLTVFSSQA